MIVHYARASLTEARAPSPAYSSAPSLTDVITPSFTDAGAERILLVSTDAAGAKHLVYTSLPKPAAQLSARARGASRRSSSGASRESALVGYSPRCARSTASMSAPITQTVLLVRTMPVSGIAPPALAAARAFAKAVGLSSTSMTSKAILRSVSPRSRERHALHHFAP